MIYQVETMAGVVEFGAPSGYVEVARDSGDTVIALVTGDNDGSVTTVYLDSGQATRLMLALGAVTVDL